MNVYSPPIVDAITAKRIIGFILGIMDARVINSLRDLGYTVMTCRPKADAS